MRRSARGREGEGDSGWGRRRRGGGERGHRGHRGSRSSAKCEEAAGNGMAAASGGAQLPSSKTCAIRMHERPVEARRMREEDQGVGEKGKAREQPDPELPRSWAPQQSVRAAFDHLTSVPLRTKLNYHRADGHQGVHIATDYLQKPKIELQHVNVGAVQTALSPPRRQPPAQTPRRPQDASPHVRTNRPRASPRIQRNAVGAKPAVSSSHRVRKMDRSEKLEVVDHLHEMAKNLRLMRKSFALLSAAKSRAENIKAVLAALKKGFPQLTTCFVLQALGQNEEFPACDGPARVVVCGAHRFAMSHWAHSESILAASQKILTSAVLQCVGARVQEEGLRHFCASLPDSSRLQCVVMQRPGGELAGLICSVAPGWLPDPDEVYLRLILRSAAANLALALRDLHVARHTQTVLGATDWRKRIIDGAACFVRQRIGANSDLWRISYLLRGALRASITGCLDCIVVFRDLKRDEGFVLLESVPSKGPVYASDGATRVVLDDRTHPETDVLMPCAQVRAKLRVYEKAQCAALKCLRTGKGPLTDPPRTRAADLVQFSMEDLCLEAQNKSWLAQTCVPILTTSDNGVEPLASLCILSEDPLEGLEIDKLEAAALAVTSTLESACKRFVARRARLATSIELQTKIDARRDERAALQAFSDILSVGVAQNPQQIQQHLSECAVSCLATETLPRIWLREDCAALLRDAKVPSESSSARLVALAENDSNSLEKRDFETAFFEPIVLEDATRILVPLIAQPEGDFLGLVESASPLLRSLEERRETNLHSAGGIAAKRWIVHTMHFASIAADLLRAGLLHRHVDFLHGSLRPGVESIRDRLRQVSQEDGGLAALVPSVRDMQMDGMRVAMRYFVVLARALVGAAGATAFAFDNTLDPTDLHEIHNSGLPDALLTNPDALYLQRRLGSTLVLRAIPTDEAKRLVPDRDFDGDLLGATEARRAANEGKADGAAQEEIRTIHTFSDPRTSQGRDALADELSNLRIAASNFADEDDTPIETSKDNDARSPHADDRSTSRSRHCQSSSTNSLRQADIKTQEIRSDVVPPDHAQLHDNANQGKLKDEKDKELEESKADEDEEEEDEEGDEQVVDSQSTSAVNLLDSLICGVEHQCTRHRPSVSVRIRQSEIEADMALRQRRFWNARAGAILQLSRFRVPHEVDILPGWLEAVRRLGARTDAFSQAEVMVVESLMANAAALWHNLWRCEDLRSMLTRESQIFNMLADVAKLISPSMPLSETGRALWQLCIHLRDLLSCDRVTILATMVHQGTTVLVPIAETSSRHQATSNTTTHASRFLVSIDSKDKVADAARQQRCLSSSALSESEEGSVFGPRSEPAEGGRAYTIWSELCIPLWSPSLERIVGVIQACNKRPLERELGVVESRREATLDWIESLESFTDVDVRLVRQSGFLPLLTTVLAGGCDLTQLHPRAKQTVRSDESSVSAAAMAQICTKQVVLSRAKESFLKGMLRAKQRMERRRQSNTSSMRRRSSSRRNSREGLSQEKQDSTHALASSRDVSLSHNDVEQDTGRPQTAVGSPSETDLSEEEKAKIRMAKLKEETADGVVPDARKFVRLAVKRFIEDETLRQDRERQTKLHRRKENRDWASMVANTDVQARLLAPSDGSARGSRLSFKVSPRRRSGIRQNSFVLRRRGNFDSVDEDLNAIKKNSKASKLAMQKMNMLMTKDA